MTGENIVCFAKEWTEDPTSNNHVMRLLAERNEVLWLNSIATRTPKLGSKDDVAKIKRKLRSLGQGPREVSQGLHVFTPLVLPFPHSRAATVANKQILRGTIAALRHKLRMKKFQAWSFIPPAAEYVGTLGEELSVYYCTDEWSQFSYVEKEKIVEQERRLIEKVDVVFTTSRGLLERKRVHNPEAHLASHGVDQAHFARALAPETPLAPELVGLRHPVVGFFGLVQDWIDTDLLVHVAKARPDWTLVVLGKALVDVSALAALPNVRLVDRRPYADLPSYCKGFDVGLCPFRINELTVHVNPIKLREYVSAGLPVVSTDIPECRLNPQWTRIGRTPEEFVAQIDAALREDSPEARRRRSDAMREETWEKKVAAIGDVILSVKERKLRSASRP
jgi:glycosyltransferase involved in cell wall biosynthesis